MAHAIARHGNERMSQQMAMNLVGAVASEVLGAKKGETAQALFDVGVNVGSQPGVRLPYSRKHEYEADRFASYTLKFTRRPNCLPEALFKIVPPEYWNVEFPTHPSVIDRVHKIKIIIDKGGI